MIWILIPNAQIVAVLKNLYKTLSKNLMTISGATLWDLMLVVQNVIQNMINLSMINVPNVGMKIMKLVAL